MPKADTTTETAAYLTTWAKQLAATIDRDELAVVEKGTAASRKATRFRYMADEA